MSLPILTPPSGQYPSSKVSTALPATPQQQPPTPNAKTAPLNDDTFVKQDSTPTTASKPRSINTEPEEDTKPSIEATTTEPEKPSTPQPSTSKLPLILSGVAAVGSLLTTGLMAFQMFEMNRLTKTVPQEIEQKATTIIKNQLDAVLPKIQNNITQGIATAQASTALMVQTVVENSTKRTLKTVLSDEAVKPLIEKLETSNMNIEEIVEAGIKGLQENKEDIEKTTQILLKLGTSVPTEKQEELLGKVTNAIDKASYEKLLNHLKEQGKISEEQYQEALKSPSLAAIVKHAKEFANSAPSKLTHAQTIAEGLLGSNDLGDILQTVGNNLSEEQRNSIQEFGSQFFN